MRRTETQRRVAGGQSRDAELLESVSLPAAIKFRIAGQITTEVSVVIYAPDGRPDRGNCFEPNCGTLIKHENREALGGAPISR